MDASAHGTVDDSRRAAGAAPRVLAAEDNAANRAMLSTILDVFGLSVELVEDGRQAVEAWRAGDYDLILMDVRMPVVDGVAATREIRALERQSGRRRTPILALSADAMAQQVADCRAAGMDAHIAKPIDLQRLRQALESALAGRTQTERTLAERALAERI